mmetsp:Transcript_35985/g.64325  ORF Transcript_35985/g.64325 Transcript_35985/m.64325 type:complete len:356 (+) Transcript_35985:1701-2768(+)
MHELAERTLQDSATTLRSVCGFHPRLHCGAQHSVHQPRERTRHDQALPCLRHLGVRPCVERPLHSKVLHPAQRLPCAHLVRLDLLYRHVPSVERASHCPILPMLHGPGKSAPRSLHLQHIVHPCDPGGGQFAVAHALQGACDRRALHLQHLAHLVPTVQGAPHPLVAKLQEDGRQLADRHDLPLRSVAPAVESGGELLLAKAVDDVGHHTLVAELAAAAVRPSVESICQATRHRHQQRLLHQPLATFDGVEGSVVPARKGRRHVAVLPAFGNLGELLKHLAKLLSAVGPSLEGGAEAGVHHAADHNLHLPAQRLFAPHGDRPPVERRRQQRVLHAAEHLRQQAARRGGGIHHLHP